MQQLILILHVLIAIVLIVLVLVQHGKGADAGAAFGSGASNTMFGSAGSTPFLVKITALLAAVFFTTSMTLTFIAAKQMKQTAPAATPNPVTKTIPQESMPATGSEQAKKPAQGKTSEKQ